MTKIRPFLISFSIPSAYLFCYNILEVIALINRIQGMESELSKAELRIFRYIKKNIDKIPTMTAEQIAKGSKTSAPTVVRFAKKVGASSLTDFKIQISAESQQNGGNQEYSDVKKNEPIASLKEKLSQNAQLTLHETTQILSDEKLVAALKLLETKERIFVTGVGASHLVAEDIKQKWDRIGKSVSLETNYNALLPQLINTKKDAALWLISNSGETPEIVFFAEIAKELKIPIITLTRFGNNRLSKLADVSLQVSRPQEADLRSAATNSLIAQFLAVDILFYSYISRNQENAEKIYQSRQIIKDFREKHF